MPHIIDFSTDFTPITPSPRTPAYAKKNWRQEKYTML